MSLRVRVLLRVCMCEQCVCVSLRVCVTVSVCVTVGVGHCGVFEDSFLCHLHNRHKNESSNQAA